ncbi:MAG: hypothetical protein IKP28_02880 [Clostridia bacterium]|nr:hypothetical protein [Clostridia bacterium]
MSSCLGIYIESNLIKYAKIAKERDTVKVEAFGVKFYDNLTEAIDQIINETYSFRVPISVNINDEQYNYFDMANLLSEKDMGKAIAIEFELLCEEKGYTKGSMEGRYILVNSPENREIVKALHVSCSKAEINKLNQEFQKNTLKTIVPLPVAIANNVEIGVKENSVILNLEEKVTLTTIINGQVNKVEPLISGMSDIFHKINSKENSYAKVYDILKNTTIYTSEGRDLQEQDDTYLQDIMPTLYDIISEAKDFISKNISNIEKMYITGTGALINNVDLYFQENMPSIKCELLRPYFMKNVSTNMTNIKDYIEVNSAIALGLQGIGEGLKDINFKSENTFEKLKQLGSMEIGGKNKGKPSSASDSKKPSIPNINIDFKLNGKLDGTEVMQLRLAGGVFIIIVAFIVISIVLNNMISNKTEEAEAIIQDTQAKIQQINSDTQKINDKVAEYSTLISNLEAVNQKIADENSVKNAIPNLMSRIMVYVPKNVQVTSIENTEGKHIVIGAQSKTYDALGYFLSAINANGILVNTKTNSGTKQDDIVRLTIEGDMP